MKLINFRIRLRSFGPRIEPIEKVLLASLNANRKTMSVEFYGMNGIAWIRNKHKTGDQFRMEMETDSDTISLNVSVKSVQTDYQIGGLISTTVHLYKYA